MKKHVVRCFENGEIVGVVEYTNNLDRWDGRNMSSGSLGRHIGIGKTKDGKYYVCHGTQWENETDFAEIVSEEEAKKLCLKHNPDIYEEIFEEPLKIL